MVWEKILSDIKPQSGSSSVLQNPSNTQYMWTVRGSVANWSYCYILFLFTNETKLSQVCKSLEKIYLSTKTPIRMIRISSKCLLQGDRHLDGLFPLQILQMLYFWNP